MLNLGWSVEEKQDIYVVLQGFFCLSKIIINITIDSRWISHASRCDALEKSLHLCSIQPEMNNPNLTTRKHQKNPKWKTYYCKKGRQGKRKDFFKNVSVVNDKGCGNIPE